MSGASSIRVAGSLLPPEVLAVMLSGGLEGLTSSDYHLAGENPREAAARVWTHLLGVYRRFRDEVDKRPAADPAVGLTRERWLTQLLSALDYGRVPTTPAGGLDVEGKTYPISHLWGSSPIHLLGWNVPLDTRSPGVPGAAQRAPHAMVQEALNRTDTMLWAIVSNGRVLRLLRDSTTLTGQAYVEFDLEAMFDAELFADFTQLYLLVHQSRVEVPGEQSPRDCWLERWRTTAISQGVRALTLLRGGVQQALETLGTGFLQHPANTGLRRRLATGDITVTDLHQSLLRTVYRLLFWFVAEDRDALLDPNAGPTARTRYRQHFSSDRLRRLARHRYGSAHHDLWDGAGIVLGALGRQDGEPRLGIPGLGGLFSNTEADVLDGARLGNQPLLAAIRGLSIVQPKGHPRRTVDFRHLGAEELGSIYESLLELVPRRDPISHTFTLEDAAGNDRKTSGSYYTPTELVDLVLDTALDPVLNDIEKNAAASAATGAAPNGAEPGLREAGNPADGEQLRTADSALAAVEAALLDVTVCDPACGSGHFLVAAARRIATRLATARTGEIDPTPTMFTEAMHDVVARCIYGVDINPMAADLAKVSLWLEAMTPGKPLSFLEHRIKVGNALLGTTPKLLHDGIPDGAYVALTGDDKRVATTWKNLNIRQRDNNLDLFTGAGVEVSNLYERKAIEEVSDKAAQAQSLADVAWAAQRYATMRSDESVVRNRRFADAWCAAFLAPKVKNAEPITHVTLEQIASGDAPRATTQLIDSVAAQHRLFHWHLEFPDVFEVPDSGLANSSTGWTGGFSCLLGNPPFVNAIEGGLDNRIKATLRALYPDLGGTADLAFYFLALNYKVLNAECSRIGIIQPRSILNAPAANSLREYGRTRLKPVLIYSPERSNLFGGAAIFVTAVVLDSEGECRVSTDSDLSTAKWRRLDINNSNWWLAMSDCALSGSADVSLGPARLFIGSDFQIGASMTTADAYDVRPFIVEAKQGAQLKLVTTGLIDPGVCLWGVARCRYLKLDFDHPRLDDSELPSRSLRRRAISAKRPKILIAGLAKRVECFLDEEGEYIGAVSTFSIFHIANDLTALRDLCSYLLSDAISELFSASLGANAMGGGSITMKKSFLESLMDQSDGSNCV